MATDGLFAANCHFYKYLCSYDWFNDEIRKDFRLYYDDFVNIAAEGGIMDQLLEEYRPLFDRNYTTAGWNVGRYWVNVQKYPLPTYEENVAYLRDWLTERVKWLDEYYPPLDESGFSFIRGDVNGDNEVTISDVTDIQKRLADMETPSFNERAADVDDNGLDISDATAIQRYLAEYENIYHIGETVTFTEPTTQPTSRDPYELPFIPNY